MNTRQIAEQIIQAHSKSIYHFCYHLSGNRTEADDLYQDTFLTFLEKKDTMMKLLSDSTKGDAWISDNGTRNYLIRIAVNLWRNKSRKQIRHSILAPITKDAEALERQAGTEEPPEYLLLKKDMAEAVQTEVRQLPEHFRTVLLLHYCMEISTEEIAKLLHIPAATVRSRLSRARKKLKQRMEAKGYDGYQ